MDQFDRVIDKELFSNIESEEKLIKKLLKCQTYKQFQEEDINLEEDAAKSIFKCATLTYTSAADIQDAARRLPAVISESAFI